MCTHEKLSVTVFTGAVMWVNTKVMQRAFNE